MRSTSCKAADTNFVYRQLVPKFNKRFITTNKSLEKRQFVPVNKNNEKNFIVYTLRSAQREGSRLVLSRFTP